MKSVVTSKFQTTIPKVIREGLKLSIHDSLEWEIKNGNVVVKPVHNKFLSHKNSIQVGEGDIQKDIETSRSLRTSKYK
ncbi:MAG: AbrB family transcriptional regulator [SAR324 cluster bacterium]|nr:AbrB family transcriptional regulator [SAR324 cluster bacterium]